MCKNKVHSKLYLEPAGSCLGFNFWFHFCSDFLIFHPSIHHLYLFFLSGSNRWPGNGHFLFNEFKVDLRLILYFYFHISFPVLSDKICVTSFCYLPQTHRLVTSVRTLCEVGQTFVGVFVYEEKRILFNVILLKMVISQK